MADDYSRFRDFYAAVDEPAVLELEGMVLGSDYGANSYTTIPQTERMATMLSLGAGDLLLDIGSGAGWPGLRLAASRGCRVVLSDVPREGLRAAMRRAGADGTETWAVSTGGERLPFADEVFDAVTHSDVLC